jgi:hypothetical protein
VSLAILAMPEAGRGGRSALAGRPASHHCLLGPDYVALQRGLAVER